MLEIGKQQTLEVIRDTAPGLFLSDSEGNEILLPGKYIPEGTKPGDLIDVFIYKDSEDRLVATTLTPLIALHQFAYLNVAEVNNYGAFLDWGLDKHLFVPFRGQGKKMMSGKSYLVYMYLDEQTQRLVASGKISHYVDNTQLTVKEGEEVDIIVWEPTDIGIKVIINQKHHGLVYDNEVFTPLWPGDMRKGYIRQIREDNKIDVLMQKPGYEQIEPESQKVLDLLVSSGGTLHLHDKSEPEEIYRQLGMSKKSFKKAIGLLYRKKKIVILEDGIQLILI